MYLIDCLVWKTWHEEKHEILHSSREADKQAYITLSDIPKEKSTKLDARVADPISYYLLSAVSKSVSQFRRKILHWGYRKKSHGWFGWWSLRLLPLVSCCNPFQCHLTHVSQLTAPVASEVYHYQHLCDKNGLTWDMWEHAGWISITTWDFFSMALSCGQYMLLAKNRSG